MIKLHNSNCLDVLSCLDPVDLIITDPPYGVSKNRTTITFKGHRSDIQQNFGEWDCFKTEEEFEFFTLRWLQEAWRVLKPGKVLCTFWSNKKLSVLESLIQAANFKLIDYYYKITSNPCPSFRKASFRSGVEPVLICQKLGGTPITSPFNRDIVGHPNYTICANVSSKQRVGGHPTQKPLACILPLVQYWSKEGEVVLDPFMGTGTTGEACVQLNRQFIGIEQDEGYFKAGSDRVNERSKER